MNKLLRVLTLFLLSSSCAFGQGMPQLVSDVNLGNSSSYPTGLTVCNGKLYFGAQTSSAGTELFSCDTSGAISLTDVLPGTGSGVITTVMQPYVKIANTIYFSGNTPNGQDHMMSFDGVTLTEIIDQNTNTYADFPVLHSVAYDGKLYGGGFADLRVFDPGTSTVHIVDDSVFACQTPVALNGKIYFSAGADTRLYEYDPVTDHIHQVQSSNLMSVYCLNVINNKLIFGASAGAYFELWSYDGIIPPQLISNFQQLVGVPNGAWREAAAYLGYIYFSGDDGVHGMELMRFDTATHVISLVADLRLSGLSSSSPMFLTVFKGKLYFTAAAENEGREIFVTDGTTTTMVPPLMPGPIPTQPEELTIFNDALYFSAWSESTGAELYKLNVTSTNAVSYVKVATAGSVYPNPAKEQIRFDLQLTKAESVRVSVTDLAGKLIRQTDFQDYEPGKNDLSMNLSNIAPGSYQYRLINKAGTLLQAGSFVHVD